MAQSFCLLVSRSNDLLLPLNLLEPQRVFFGTSFSFPLYLFGPEFARESFDLAEDF